MQVGVPQKITLGQFIFNQEIDSKYHEILVGSRKYHSNRISFPSKLYPASKGLIQVEYYYPESEQSRTNEEWQQVWLDELRQLGIISASCQPSQVGIIEERRGMATTASFESITDQYHSAYKNVGSNVTIPYFNLGPENINRVVPGVLSGTQALVSQLR